MTELFDENVAADEIEIPPTLPVLPLKDTVVFPDSMLPLAVGQERSIELIDDVIAGDRLVALIPSRTADIEVPGWDDLYEVGTAAIVQKMLRVPDGTQRILVQGLRRIRLTQRVRSEPYLVGRFEPLPDVVRETRELQALTQNVRTLFARIIALLPYLPEELAVAAANVEDPSALSHLVASTLRLKTEEKQRVLEEVDVEKRLREILVVLNRELEVVELGSKIQSQVQSEMESTQREYFLRQQLKAIQQELGEDDPEQAELKELRERAAELELPEETRKAFDREVARLEKLPSAAAEYGVIRTYLEWILSLPWNKVTEDDLELAVEDDEDLVQALIDVDQLQDPLLFVGLQAQRRGDEVRERARVLDVRRGQGQLLGQVRQQADQAREEVADVLRQRLQLARLADDVRERLEAAHEVRVGADALLEADAPQALDENPLRPVGDAEHLLDDCRRADLVDLLPRRDLDLARARRDQRDEAVARDDVVDQLDRALLADRQGQHRVGVDDRVLERKDRERLWDLDVVGREVLVEELAHFAFLIGIDTRIGSDGFFAAGSVIVRMPRR